MTAQAGAGSAANLAPPSAREPEQVTLGQVLAAAARRVPGDTPRLEAEALLAHGLGRPRAWLLAHPETVVSPAEQAEFQAALERLMDGEPLAYLTGRREFFGLEFLVNPHVLVPRPETELLVETALAAGRALLAERQARNPDATLRVADIGTGSGCIAVSLAVHEPEWQIVATDLSAEALAIAWQNAARHGLAEQIDFRQGDVFEPLSTPVDLVCANLPYIDSTELAALAVSRHEPRLALDGGPGGLKAIRRLVAAAPRCVSPGGRLLLEIGAGQGEAAAALAHAAFPEANIAILQDLAALDRLLSIQL